VFYIGIPARCELQITNGHFPHHARHEKSSLDEDAVCSTFCLP
jgi:hypothetical protein